jgi:hypothetical protein
VREKLLHIQSKQEQYRQDAANRNFILETLPAPGAF